MQMIPIRIFFEKTGRAKYTSHLDTMRTMTRAFRRSKLPFWYTQGFNPHLYMTFALPISLGYESLCESVDLRLTQPVDYPDVVRQLNASLPPGFVVTKVADPVQDPAAIAWADYRIVLRYPGKDTADIQERLRQFLSQPVIEVEKRTKKGHKVVDIKPLTQLLSVELAPEILTLDLRLSAGSDSNINPNLLLQSFFQWCGFSSDGIKVVRTAILNSNLGKFA